MALANIIKEVDPPVELTQAEYDALSTAQKNDGTVYFITDGNGAFQTAATTPAEDTSGGTSNVQDELQKKVEKADVVNNFTTTQEGYVADARALKTIADNYSLKTDLTNLKEGADSFEVIALNGRIHDDVSHDAAQAHITAGSSGLVYAVSEALGGNINNQTQTYITDKYGMISTRYRTRASKTADWGDWSSFAWIYPMRSKDISGTTDANGFISLGISPDHTLPIIANTRKGGGSLSDRYVEFTPGTSSWYGRVTYRGAAIASTSIKFRFWYMDCGQDTF